MSEAVAPHKPLLSMRRLAALVGRHESAVRKWKKRPDWPFGDGPFDLDQVRLWMQVHLKRDPARRYHDARKGIGPQPLSDLEKARTKNYEEAARKRQLEREEIEGKLHDKRECSIRRRRQVYAIRNALTRTLPRTLAAELVGRARGDMEQLIRQRLEAVCNGFAQQVNADE